jgi:hypothetical protein
VETWATAPSVTSKSVFGDAPVAIRSFPYLPKGN